MRTRAFFTQISVLIYIQGSILNLISAGKKCRVMPLQACTFTPTLYSLPNGTCDFRHLCAASSKSVVVIVWMYFVLRVMFSVCLNWNVEMRFVEKESFLVKLHCHICSLAAPSGNKGKHCLLDYYYSSNLSKYELNTCTKLAFILRKKMTGTL